jgi:hypothetical protein
MKDQPRPVKQQKTAIRRNANLDALIIVLSPHGKLSHLVVHGHARTYCGKIAENWQIGGYRRGRPDAPPSSVSCRPCRSRFLVQP